MTKARRKKYLILKMLTAPFNSVHFTARAKWLVKGYGMTKVQVQKAVAKARASYLYEAHPSESGRFVLELTELDAEFKEHARRLAKRARGEK